MQPTPPPPPDIVTVAISLASALFGANVSTAVGTYSVIIVFAVAGAAWSASGRPEGTRWAALRHGIFMVMLALALTVPLAEGLHQYVDLESRWTLAPIAALVAARPEWVIGQLVDLWRWWRGARTPQPGGPQ